MKQDCIEVWKPIEGHDGYEVSNLGRVRSWRRKRLLILKPILSWRGYHTIHLRTGKTYADRKIHRLVATAFIENALNHPQVNHKDTNKLNNCVDNLEWCTNSENRSHAVANGKISARGSGRILGITARVFRRLRGRVSAVSLSKLFGISPSYADRIQRGLACRHPHPF